MDRDSPPPSDTDRGQTAQDFAVGIGLFLLAVAFVFIFVPQIVEPYEAGIGSSEHSQADRAATMIVHNVSEEGSPGVLDPAATASYLSTDDVEVLRERTGLPFTARINVTVRNVETGTMQWSDGAVYREGRAAATATRIVRTTDDTCEPACRLDVRGW